MTQPAPAIDSRAGFHDAVRWFFQAAAERGARRIVCCDPDFQDWPLDDPALLDALSVWLRGSPRRLVLVASSFDRVARRQPRFVRWRRQWSHAIEALAPAEPALHTVPTVAFDDGPLGLELIDRVAWRGRAVRNPQQAFSWRESVQELMHRCEPAFPPDTLGL